VLRSSATIRASSARFRLVECEPAFRFKREIPAGIMTIGPDEVAEAIGSILPAMELPESRFASIGAHGPFALVADGGAAGWVVLGPEQPFDGSERWDNAEATLEIDGHEVARGFAREIEGGPFAALVAHCSTMVARGRTIPAGLVVLPGSCTGAVAVPAGSTATAKFGRFGEVRITFPTD